MRSDLRARQEVIARRLALLAPPGREGEVDPALGQEQILAPEILAPEILAPEVLAPQVPIVGRHAERRRWLPTALRGPAGMEPWHGVVVALVAVAVLAGCCWWLLQRAPQVEVAPGPTLVSAPALTSVALATPMAGVTPIPGASGMPGGSPSAAAGAMAGGTVTVDVAGKVRHPGVRRLPTGSRVVDALRAAGGPRRGVDLSSLNQARVLVDGEQITVGQAAPRGTANSGVGGVSGSVPGGQAGAGGQSGGLVNLNTATAAELDTLPGVGPVTAQSILDYRTQHGGFSAVAELLDIDGIGEATLAKLEPHVTV